MACLDCTNAPPVGDAPPTNGHQGGGFVRMDRCGSSTFWVNDINANCHSIFNLKAINCIPLSDFLTTPLNTDVDAAGHAITNLSKVIIGSSTDDGSGALLQVAGEVNAQSYMVNKMEFASSPAPNEIDLSNIHYINGAPLPGPIGSEGSVQFNDDGLFMGDNYFVYDEITHSLRVGMAAPSSPQWRFEVGGDINIADPTRMPYAYRINGIPFALLNTNMTHIDLVNIGNINGAPPGSGGSGSAPGGVTGEIQFNSAGLFAGSANLFWDATNFRLGIGTNAPAYPADIVGIVNASNCYYVAGVPFACTNGSGGINLTNVTNVNGGSIGPAAPVQSLQWNNNGAFGGSAALVWNSAASLITLNGSINITSGASAIPIRAISGNNTGLYLNTSVTGAGATVDIAFQMPGILAQIGGRQSPPRIEFKQDNGEFAFFDLGTSSLSIGTDPVLTPPYKLNVSGDTWTTGCFVIGGAAPFVRLCNDGNGNLLVNGAPVSGTGGDLAGLIAGQCISITQNPGPPRTATVSAVVSCIQSPWVTPINAGGFNLTNTGSISGLGPLTITNNINTNSNLIVSGSANVTGNVSINGCYYIAGVVLACSNGAGAINLSNIANINGASYPPGASLTPPAGTNTMVQYNSNGSFGANAGFVYTGANVGIGTTSPSFPLTVSGGAGGILGFSSPSGDIAQVISRLDNGSGPTGSLHFLVRDFGTWIESVTMQWDGKVGIGYTAPNAALTIGAGGRTTYFRPDNTTGQFGVGYTQNDLDLRWNFNDGISIMTLDNTGNLNIEGNFFANSVEIVGAYFGPTKTFSNPMLFCGNDQDPGNGQDRETLTFFINTFSGQLICSWKDNAGVVHVGAIAMN